MDLPILYSFMGLLCLNGVIYFDGITIQLEDIPDEVTPMRIVVERFLAYTALLVCLVGVIVSVAGICNLAIAQYQREF